MSKTFPRKGWLSGGSRVLGGSVAPPPPPPPPPDPTGGTPYGTSGCWTASPAALKANTSVFSFSRDSETPSRLLTHITAAKGLGKKLVPMLTSGSHSRLTSPGLGNYTSANLGFNLDFWKHGDPDIPGTGMDIYDTPQVIDAVEQAIEDGVILGLDMIDEPQAADWGGNITKVMLNDMALYLKGIFPSASAGATVRSDYKQGASGNPNYTDLDFIVCQWIQGFELGSNGKTVQEWRDARLVDAHTNGVKLVFSINVLNGGSTASGVSSCPAPTGGYSPVRPANEPNPRCSMGTTNWPSGSGLFPEPAPGGQLYYYASELMKPHTTLGYKAIALQQWEYEAAYFARVPMRAAFATLAAEMAARPAQSWYR